MGGKKGRRVKLSLSSSYETDYYAEEIEMEEEVLPDVVPKNDNQRDYNRVLYSINKPMVFAVGPAGTGKTC